MTGLQEFRENLFFGEETSDHECSILLVDIMNALSFSKCERDIRRYSIHLNNTLLNIFGTDYNNMKYVRWRLWWYL